MNEEDIEYALKMVHSGNRQSSRSASILAKAYRSLETRLAAYRKLKEAAKALDQEFKTGMDDYQNVEIWSDNISAINLREALAEIDRLESEGK